MCFGAYVNVRRDDFSGILPGSRFCLTCMLTRDFVRSIVARAAGACLGSIPNGLGGGMSSHSFAWVNSNKLTRELPPDACGCVRLPYDGTLADYCFHGSPKPLPRSRWRGSHVTACFSFSV